MPGKSRYSKGKHPHHSKKSKAIIRQAGTPMQPQATAAAPKPEVTARAQPTPKPAATPAVVTTQQHRYVTAELKRIGILAGITIVILIVLSIVLT